MNSSVFLVFLELIIPLVPLSGLRVVSHFLPVWSSDLCCPPLHLQLELEEAVPSARAVPVPHPAPSMALLLQIILQKVLHMHPEPIRVSSQGMLCCALVSGLDRTPFPALGFLLVHGPGAEQESGCAGMNGAGSTEGIQLMALWSTPCCDSWFRGIFGIWPCWINRRWRWAQLAEHPGFPKAFPACLFPSQGSWNVGQADPSPASPGSLVYWEC